MSATRMGPDGGEHDNQIVLLAIRSEHAERLYSGRKRVELRKTFPRQTVRLMFLYETKPKGAITGVALVQGATFMHPGDAARIAARYGVPHERTERYFGARLGGWVIRVGPVFRLKRSMSLAEARRLNHYFVPPQVFSYLPKTEALTQVLLREMCSAVQPSIALVRPSERLVEWFRKEMLSRVGEQYADINDDFVSQVIDNRGHSSAFSTKRKDVLAVQLRGVPIGAVALTWKTFNAVKTGPTILMRAFEGLGLGLAVRGVIEERCRSKGVRRLYCTCPVNKGGVVKYLLDSGMRVEARLVKHLSPSRDEFVFAKDLRSGRAVRRDVPLKGSPVHRIELVSPRGAESARVCRFVARLMKSWYFVPARGFAGQLLSGMRAPRSSVVRYSDKPRLLCAAYDDAGRTVGAAIGTLKRSNMMKMNVVAMYEDPWMMISMVTCLLRKVGVVRRCYMTLPVSRVTTILSMLRLGFEFEGILKGPFQIGMDHVCLGRSHGPVKVALQFLG